MSFLTIRDAASSSNPQELTTEEKLEQRKKVFEMLTKCDHWPRNGSYRQMNSITNVVFELLGLLMPWDSTLNTYESKDEDKRFDKACRANEEKRKYYPKSIICHILVMQSLILGLKRNSVLNRNTRNRSRSVLEEKGYKRPPTDSRRHSIVLNYNHVPFRQVQSRYPVHANTLGFGRVGYHQKWQVHQSQRLPRIHGFQSVRRELHTLVVHRFSALHRGVLESARLEGNYRRAR